LPIIRNAVRVESNRNAIRRDLGEGSNKLVTSSSPGSGLGCSVHGVGSPGSLTGMASNLSSISGSERSKVSPLLDDISDLRT
jgi:hypothetical protein